MPQAHFFRGKEAQITVVPEFLLKMDALKAHLI